MEQMHRVSGSPLSTDGSRKYEQEADPSTQGFSKTLGNVHANFLNPLPDLQNVILNPCLKRRTSTWLEV